MNTIGLIDVDGGKRIPLCRIFQQLTITTKSQKSLYE